MALNRRVVGKAAGLAFVLFIASSCFGYNWPFKEGGAQTVEQRIRQTVGANRGNGARFHRGLDVCPNDPANIAVYAVNSGVAELEDEGTDNEAIIIGEIWYIHLYADHALEDSTISIGDSLGIMRPTPGCWLHLHFQEGGTAPNIVNPLASLTPFTDTRSPRMDVNSIEFYDQTADTQLSEDTLRGRVDIDVTVYDTLNHSTAELLGRVYPYSLQHQILDTLGTTLLDTMKIRFDRVPPNVHVSWILKGNDRYPRFRITNVALDGQTVTDHYWNTKQKDDGQFPPCPEHVDAESVDVAKFKRGNYWVKVLAYDIRENFDAESIKVYIDNFGPRVDSIYPPDSAIGIPPDTFIYVRFDEPMEN